MEKVNGGLISGISNVPSRVAALAVISLRNILADTLKNGGEGGKDLGLYIVCMQWVTRGW